MLKVDGDTLLMEWKSTTGFNQQNLLKKYEQSRKFSLTQGNYLVI